MNKHMEDDLPKGSFYGLVIDKILVDAFKPKFGDEKNFAVFSFLVKQREAANKLMSYIVQKNLDLLDVEVSPNPKPDSKNDVKYILFIEMNRNKDMFATMDKLLLHIDHLVSIKQWYFRASAYKKYMDWNKGNFVKIVCQTPDEYSNKGPISKGHDEVENVPQNLKGADIDHSLLEEIIERQVAKFNQSYIKSLKEQIKTINENKLQLSRHIEDLKINRDHLYKQLELSHDREKIALIREQQDFKRIKSLKNQLALLAAPGSRKMEIIIPDKTAYDTDVKPVVGVAATEADVKDEEELYAEIQNEYKEASRWEQHPDESPALNESSGLDVVFDLPDKITFEESSGFVRQRYRDDPDVDESIEKPAQQPDQKAFINAEKEKPEKDKIDKTNNKKANLVAEQFVSAEDEDVRKSETPVELQDLKHIKSDDSAATARSDNVVAQIFLEESTAKVDDKSHLADDPVPKYMVLGQKALEKENYDNAIEYFLKVVDILPTAGIVVLNLADLYFLKKEYKVAEKYAVRALELGEDSATLLLNKIKMALAPDTDQPSIEKSGEEIAENLIAREEGYSQGAEELEDTIFIELAALNEITDSTENTTPDSIEYTVLNNNNKIDADKDNTREYIALGAKAAEQNDYHKAIKYFTKAVEIFPDSAAAFFNLAVLNYRLKEYKTAYMYAQKAIDLGSPSATQILKKIKSAMAAVLKSPAEFEPAVEVKKTTSPLVVEKNEDESFFIESAAATLDEFLKSEKQNQPDLTVDSSLREKDAVVNDSFKLGLAAFENKEFRKAIGHFNKVVELLPNGIPSYIHLTKIYYSLGEYPQARKHAEKAFALGDYTLKPFLEKIDAKLAKESAHPSTGSKEPKEQETPAEAIEGTQEKPGMQESHTDTKTVNKAVGDEPELKIMVEKPDVEFVEPVSFSEATGSKENTTPASTNKVVPIASPAKKKEKPLAEEVPIQTGEVKPDHIIEAQSELQDEEPKETIGHGKTGLKQAQNLVEPAGTMRPAAGNEFVSEAPPQATSLETENPQFPREYGSIDEYFKAGLAASERNDFNIALEYFNKVAVALPKAPSSFLNMAYLHYRMKNYKTAHKHAQRALELGAHSAHRILSKIEDSLEVKRKPDPIK